MSQSVITVTFEQWKAQEVLTGKIITLDEFVFAHIPGLDPSKPIDRNEKLPPAAQIKHRQAVNKTGVVNNNAVAYSVTMGANVGDFEFNWIGLLNKQSGTVAMIVHAPVQSKIKTVAGQQGNVLTRSFLLEYVGAAKETAINTPAEMWQIDFTARLSGIDEMQRLVSADIYGEAAFFGDSFLVSKKDNQFFVTTGTGYIGGLRAVLEGNKNITVPAKAVKVWADVSYQGNITSQWRTMVKLTVAETAVNYIDDTGFAHYVFAVASVTADGKITDLRPKDSLNQQHFDDALKDHEKSRNHPDATLKEKGFTQLTSELSESESQAATPKLVNAVSVSAHKAAKDANDNANKRLLAEGTAVAAQKLITARKISGVLFDGTTDITLNACNVGAATPEQVKAAKEAADNAQQSANGAQKSANAAQETANGAATAAKGANDNANKRVPSTRKVNGKELSADITLTAGDVGALTFVNGAPTKMISGLNLNDGQTANLPEDCRGKIMWVWCNESSYPPSQTIIPTDNYPVSTHFGREGAIELMLINNGKTIKVNYTRESTRLGRIDIWK